MNNKINSSWVDAHLYEVSFVSKKNNINFVRTCAVPLTIEEQDLLNWFLENFKQTSNIELNLLGDIWVKKDSLFFY
ncbi:hypothetical protein G8C15_17085 [Enterococcus casseliflavus]|nr:hypothetical protein [Enterococcus casseliflavus]MBF0014401.1 hypothetical protein [Enterococcus casseliflavus]